MEASTTASQRNGHRNGRHTSTLPSPRSITVGEIARLLNAEFVGDAHTLITSVASIDSTIPGSIAFVENDHLLKTALDSSAAAIIAPSSSAREMPESTRRGKPMVLAVNPRLAFAKVMEYLQPTVLPEKGIHPTAIIEPDAYIGANVTIREFCYIGHHARIGDGAVLFPHVVVGDGAQIGNASILYSSVVLNYNVQIGARVRIHSSTVIGSDGFGYVLDEGTRHKVPQVGTVIIEDDVEIGANVCIDRATMGATRVGKGTKIDNLVQVAHNCQIGRNVILCAMVGLSGSVVVEDNVVLAGQVGARDHVKIGAGATVGAQSGIITDVAPGALMLGSPAIMHREKLKNEAAARKVPDSLRTLRQLEKQLHALQEEVEALKNSSA